MSVGWTQWEEMITASTLHAPLQGSENEGNEIHLEKDTRRKKYCKTLNFGHP